MGKNKDTAPTAESIARKNKIRRLAEGTATFGLLLICVAMVSPFASSGNPDLMRVFCWIYAAGALIYTVARMADVSDPRESTRLRRMRRMEFWAGMAFCIASGFWFYNTGRLGPNAGLLGILRNTVTFTVVGAVLQIIASWMIASRMKKEGLGPVGKR